MSVVSARMSASLLVLISLCVTVNAISTAETAVLEVLVAQQWIASAVCDGVKVGCSAGRTAAVTKLNLANARLSGTLPSEIGQLTSLTELHLNGNKFYGAVPSAYTALTKITTGMCALQPQVEGSLTCSSAVKNSTFAKTCNLNCELCSPACVHGNCTGVNVCRCTSGYTNAVCQMPIGGCAGTAPTNGAVGTCLSVTAGANCTATCSAGYSVSPAVSVCKSGVLSAQACVGNPCAVPKRPTNGQLGTCVAGAVSGGNCSFACDAGFKASPAVATCLAGVLSAQVCQYGRCTRTAPANGTVGTCARVATGTNCTITCRAGTNATPAVAFCNQGVLTSQSCIAPGSALAPAPATNPAPAPATNPAPAPAPAVGGVACSRDAPEYGSVGTCVNVSSGESCSIVCDTGFVALPASASCADGALSDQICAAVVDGGSCTRSAPANGTIGNCGTVESGSSCSVQCDGGFTATPATASCNDSVLTTQTCIATPAEVDCVGVAPANGLVGTCERVPDGSRCSVTCNTGYEVSPATAACVSGVLDKQTCLVSSVTPTPSSPPTTSAASANAPIFGSLVVAVLLANIAAVGF